VTPIFTWGKSEGFVNFPVPDAKGNGLGSCRLQINLLATPPSGDILLIGCAKPCRGSFTGLKEGGTVRAEFGGKAYEWKLTYHGGRRLAQTQGAGSSVQFANRFVHNTNSLANRFRLGFEPMNLGEQRPRRRRGSCFAAEGGRLARTLCFGELPDRRPRPFGLGGVDALRPS